MNVIIALYDEYNDAAAVKKDLTDDGMSSSSISTVASGNVLESHAADIADNVQESGPLALGSKSDNLAGRMIELGVPRDEADFYAEGVRRGGTLVAAEVDQSSVDNAAAIMGRRETVDYQERTTHWRGAGWTGHDASAAPYTAEETTAERTRYGTAGAGNGATTGSTADTLTNGGARDRHAGDETVVSGLEERMAVGKREVEGGGVRVRRYTREVPVEAGVRLRDENVHVDRQAVDRPVAAGDNPFDEMSVELTETKEEAVVAKDVRVTEEVRVSKDADVRDQVVHDTVRRADVEVEDTRTGRGDTSTTRKSGDAARLDPKV